MAKPRKLWRTDWRDDASAYRSTRHESQAAAYRYVRNDAANYACNPDVRPRFTEVWVDERDGRGWQLYERVDLADYGAWES